MHEPIKEHLEEYLMRSHSARLPAEFTAHLASCAECRRELAVMEAHSRVVRVLQPRQELEPSAGFYARILERIEAQRPLSIWSIFLEPFGRRIAFASMALAVMMSVYLYSTEPGASNAILADEDQPGLVLGATPEQERGAVFVDLASYRGQ
jgi:hypothetical protein